jgi:hypothetical protein
MRAFVFCVFRPSFSALVNVPGRTIYFFSYFLLVMLFGGRLITKFDTIWARNATCRNAKPTFGRRPEDIIFSQDLKVIQSLSDWCIGIRHNCNKLRISWDTIARTITWQDARDYVTQDEDRSTRLDRIQ